MNLYEVTLYETIKKTLIYEIKARGEKEAKRRAKKLYKYEREDEGWITGYNISEEAGVLLLENDVPVDDE